MQRIWQKLNLRIRLIIIEVTAVLLLSIMSAYPAHAKIEPVIASQPPAFEVASIRLSPRGKDELTSISPAGTSRFTAKNATLTFLIEFAFDINDYQIAGVPNWSDSTLYDISAAAESGVNLTYEQLRPRLQQLLEKRLHLTVHHDVKSVKGYGLVVAKGGPKLQTSKGAAGQLYILGNGLRGQNMPIKTLASMLNRPTGRPLADKTGIEGNYDIRLDYAPNGATDSPLPSVFTALQEQLGLKLEPQQVPVEMLVIDHVDRQPTEN
jgi:uncharacterized protein (TIGR03435 family)